MISVLKILVEIKNMLKKCEYRELLWTNPSPKSAFKSQLVALDLSKHNSVIIKYCNYPYADDRNVTTYTTQFLDRSEIAEGRIDVCISGDTSNNFWAAQREAKLKDNGVHFTDGFYKIQNNLGWTLDNKNLIPIKIYGIRSFK